MGINKEILKKVAEKTNDNEIMQKFIINILQKENKGIGWYTKIYKAEVDKAVKEIKNEN